MWKDNKKPKKKWQRSGKEKGRNGMLNVD